MKPNFRFIIEEKDIQVDLVERTDNEIVFKVHRVTKSSPSRKKLNHELIIELWNQGIPASEIAKQVGTTEKTIYDFARKNAQCQRRKKGRKLTFDANVLITLWNQGIPAKEIAKTLGVCTQTVYKTASDLPECSPRKTKAGENKNVPTESSVIQNDYPRTGEHLRKNEIEALCKMWRAGKRNVAELARYFEVSKNTIYYQLRINGCKGAK